MERPIATLLRLRRTKNFTNRKGIESGDLSALVTVRALFGVVPVRRDRIHIVALRAHTVDQVLWMLAGLGVRRICMA